MRRGWYISPHSELFWECEYSPRKASQSFPVDFPLLIEASEAGNTCLDKIPLKDYDWGDIVEAYSNCKLTLESDKLVAISGIARAK